MNDAATLGSLVAGIMPGLAARQVLFVPPQVAPPPPGAWMPGQLSVQIILRGRIELGLPRRADVRWTTATARHWLVVCPGGWSPRMHATARRHLALTFGDTIQVACYDTPAGGGRPGPELATMVRAEGPLAPVLAAVRSCAAQVPHAEVLVPLLSAALPLLRDVLRGGDPAGNHRRAAIHAWLRAHCRDALQRDTVAAHFGISGDHLTRLLAPEGFIRLLQTLRLEHACTLLRDPSLTVAEIANRCQFGGASYLIRLFRRRYGMTPAAWRHACLVHSPSDT